MLLLLQQATDRESQLYRHYELGHAQGLCQLCMLSRLPTTLKSSLKLSLQQAVQSFRPMSH